MEYIVVVHYALRVDANNEEHAERAARSLTIDTLPLRRIVAGSFEVTNVHPSANRNGDERQFLKSWGAEGQPNG